MIQELKVNTNDINNNNAKSDRKSVRRGKSNKTSSEKKNNKTNSKSKEIDWDSIKPLESWKMK